MIKYLIEHSYDKIFCKIHTLKVLLYWKFSYLKLLNHSNIKQLKNKQQIY